jgi:hypothetical protein
MNKRVIGRSVAACIALMMGLRGGAAYAYNWKTHSRIVEMAAQVMQPAFNDPSSPPSGVDPALWSQYVGAIRTGVSRFGVLKSGLPDAKGETTTDCGYRAQDDMSQIPNDRIEDLPYLPLQGGNVQGGSPTQYGGECSEKPIQASCPADPTADDDALRIGRVLGVQGASADNHEEDSTLWYRPTNALFLGAVNSVLTQGFNDAAGALLLPFVCLADFFLGKSCDFKQSQNLASEVNPIDHIEGLIPGVHSMQSYDYVGLWHFVNQATPFGNYNTVPGLLYTSAGPFSVPGALDVGITLWGDISGLSLDAGASAGVSRYGQFDEVSRDNPQWQAQTLGHTEFSPISHMAQFGWNLFASNPTTAMPLTWPLHAFGDASEPQHVAGTTSWGHRPYEDEVDNLLDTQLLPPPPGCTLSSVQDAASAPLDPAQTARILLIGFNFWNTYHTQFSPGNVPVQAMVNDLASQTLSIARAAELAQPGSVYNDALSILYVVGLQQTADTGYSLSAGPMRAMLEEGTGATIAFLAGASLSVTDPGANASQFCPTGSAFDFTVGTCVGGFQPTGSFQDASGLSPSTPVSADAGSGSACGFETPCPSGSCTSGFECIAGCCQENPR